MAAGAGAMMAGSMPAGNWLAILPVALAIAGGAALLMLRHRARGQGAGAVALLAAIVAVDALLLRRVLTGGPVVMTMGNWQPPFGIAFAVDALGAGFALAASFVALCCCLYSFADIDAPRRRYGFYPFMMLMMAGVNGAFLTGDIFNLYVWFEVFLISSFGLLILGSEREQIDGATKYAVLNLIATALFLIATAYLYGALGTLNMADIARRIAAGADAAPLATIAGLYLLAFAMKAAAFPLNFWLPASYHTPRIVTGALFGGLLTKVGIYALLRVLVMLMPEQGRLYAPLLEVVAIGTMLVGSLGALAQSDLRRMAGFLVISGVGVMLAGLATGGEAALAGTIVYGLHSMLAMAILYLLIGAMKDLGGSFSLHELGSLYRRAPGLAALALFVVLSVAGLPPGSGLWPKALLAKASLDAGAWWLAAGILATGFLSTIALGRMFALAFWRDTVADEPQISTPVPRRGQGRAALLALAVPLAAMGLYPEPFLSLSAEAARGLMNADAYIGAVFATEAR
ncbi:MAG: Na+/H+ antiporter subunit D [Rhizobiaceae bacterium]